MDFLYAELIGKMSDVNTSQAEQTLADDIFARLSAVPLVDRYVAYQALDDNWAHIAVDLEIIQTEGFAATRQVDPNMVVKGAQEVQDGWIGHILPFDLVQRLLLADDLNAIKKKENLLAEIASSYEALLDELSEEDKEQNYVNETKDAFVPAEVKKAIKAKDCNSEILAILNKADYLNTKEKTLKKEIKEDSGALHIKTKKTIESLSDEVVLDLLRHKWIFPLLECITAQPDLVLADFISKLDALTKKYETTFAAVEQEIAETEQSLSSMLDELTGNEFDMRGLAEFKKLLGGK